MQSKDSKRCTKCGAEKGRDDFGRDRTRPDGLFPWCKRCRWKTPSVRDVILAKTSEGLRCCTRCKQWKPLSAFGSNRYHSDGRNRQCKPCATQQTKQTYYSNVEASRARGRELARANADKIRLKNRKAYLKDVDKSRDRVKQWYEKNRERLKGTRSEYLREWARSEHGRQVLLSNVHKRRARTKGSYTAQQWETLLDACGRICLRCGVAEAQSIYALRKSGNKVGKLTVDHILAIAVGGSNTIDNLQCLCMPC